MGTRHLIMVVKGGTTRVAQYGQWDGYPSGQGVAVLDFVRKLNQFENMQVFKDQLDKCVFVDEKRIDEMWSEKENNPKNKNLHEQISRDTSAGILNMIVENNEDTLELYDQTDFAQDSLMCEWVYVIDLSENVLEVYEGFNKDQVPLINRFQGKGQPNYNGSETYYPVVHKGAWLLSNLPSDDEFITRLDPPEKDEDETPEDEFTKDAIRSVLDHIRSGDHGNDLVTDRLCNYLDANVDEILEAYEDIDDE